MAFYRTDSSIVGLEYNEEKIGEFLLNQDGEITRNAQDASLVIEDGQATEFVADLLGQNLELKKSARLIRLAFLAKKLDNVVLAIHETAPQITLSETNDLGIIELISQGVSDFSGSTWSRIHNIEVGASKYRGIIIKQGEEFSFNQYLGPVTAREGYLPELVIKAGGTVPEYGGGLCQVSSTAFRAAFFGGMPITQRKNHSYAVSYYRFINDEMPASEGLDATIYPGVVDMKFKNDTQGAILIWTRIEGNRLYFDFYGTLDDRKIVVDGPYTYDRRQSGALKARVSRTVIKGSEETEQVFHSTYVSPNLYPRTYEYAEDDQEV